MQVSFGNFTSFECFGAILITQRMQINLMHCLILLAYVSMWRGPLILKDIIWTWSSLRVPKFNSCQGPGSDWSFLGIFWLVTFIPQLWTMAVKKRHLSDHTAASSSEKSDSDDVLLNNFNTKILHIYTAPVKRKWHKTKLQIWLDICKWMFSNTKQDNLFSPVS